MSLKRPTPGLAPIGVRLRYDSKRPFKGQIIVEGGSEVDVPADLAAQLEASDTHWKRDDLSAPDEVRAEEARHLCPTCGFEAKSLGGLANHQRSHEED